MIQAVCKLCCNSSIETPLFLSYFLLEHSCFPLLCQILLSSRRSQSQVYAYPLPSGFLPPQVTTVHQAEFPVLYNVIISYLFYDILYTIAIAYMCQPQSPNSSLLTNLWNIETLNCLLFLRKTIYLNRKPLRWLDKYLTSILPFYIIDCFVF